MPEPTLGDVYGVFTQLTGLAWYPPLDKVRENDLWGDAQEQVDSIISAQANAKGMAHRAAEQDKDSALSSEAADLFIRFQEWAIEAGNVSTV
ncbi:MAG: hypothetical protein CMI53_02745 [Parcubacteria group bacterium]|jgi:hypothetical protein|nr:hypothetical protein [Parcubacteria group bacterium]|tara:strand:- start:959 stop:1234 length:276 start_codon:yes stop_codon:yes gene_type:complete